MASITRRVDPDLRYFICIRVNIKCNIQKIGDSWEYEHKNNPAFEFKLELGGYNNYDKIEYIYKNIDYDTLFMIKRTYVSLYSFGKCIKSLLEYDITKDNMLDAIDKFRKEFPVLQMMMITEDKTQALLVMWRYTLNSNKYIIFNVVLNSQDVRKVYLTYKVNIPTISSNKLIEYNRACPLNCNIKKLSDVFIEAAIKLYEKVGSL